MVLAIQSMQKSRTYIQKSNVEDLQTSGSGYSYQIRSGDPFIFKSYKSDLTGKQKLENSLNFMYFSNEIFDE